MYDNSLNPGINQIDKAKIRVKFDGSCLKQEKVTFNHRKLYEINLWLYTQDANFALGNSLLGAVILTKTFCSHKYCYFVYGIGFDEPGIFWQELI